MVNRQKAAKRKRETGLAVTMRCEWVDCGLTSTDIEEFYLHVEEHAKEKHKEEKDGREYVCCMWQLCGFTSLASTINFHVNYHSYHTHLKALGTALLSQNPNLDCHQDITQRNLVATVRDVRVCEWEACNFNTDNYNKLLQHARKHVTGQPRRTQHQIVCCLWQGCGRSQKDMTKLKSHVRSHTQEKAIACPVCGTQFASNTKFIDHCARQQRPLASQPSFKCSYCKKGYPSERILQNHFRVHTHMYKCPMCDMTCPYKYSLALHMRYRHLKDRPFPCSFCQDRFTTERDLKTHYQVHSDENVWACEEEGCDFRARSSNGLTTHVTKAHGQEVSQYGCHICDAIYHRGAALTQHLKREHAYRWASGMSRFRYIKDESGVHRLQTVRHESLEVVEQIVANATIRRPRQRKRFTIVSNAPDVIVISEQPTSSRDDSEEDDPDDVMGEEAEEEEEGEVGRESVRDCSDMPDLASSPISMCSPEEDCDGEDESFGECLKQHLGLVDGFIQVVSAK